MSQQVEAHILKRYNLGKKVGSGAYGHVWKVTDRKGGQTLALKKIFDAFQHSTDAQRTYREIVFLHQLEHPNIIRLHNVFRAENDKDLYLVFEYMEADLHNAIGYFILKNCRQKILKDIHNRFIIYQLVKGIKFLHSAELLHRDLKPSNVLLNSDCVLKICDFGLARSLTVDNQGSDIVLTEEVATRWYRAPQVLLGSQTYDKSADMWSIGCILAQMMTGKPFFPGNSTLNQLERIVSFTGKPKKQDVASLNSEIAGTMIDSLSDVKIKSTNDWFKPDTPAEAINLVCRLLSFNPQKRLSANEVLRHPFLAKFHNSKQEIESNKIINPPISDNKKLNLKQYRQLIYDRIKKIYKDEISSSYKGDSQKKIVSSKQTEPERQNNQNTSSSVKVTVKSGHKDHQASSSSHFDGYQASSNYNHSSQKVVRKDSQTFQNENNPIYENSIQNGTRNQSQQLNSSQTQKLRPSSANKNNDQYGSGANGGPTSQNFTYLQRSQQHHSGKLKTYDPSSISEEQKFHKKNSLKDALRNKRQSPSFKDENRNYTFNGLGTSSSHHTKPATAMTYIPSTGVSNVGLSGNGSSTSNANLNKFYKNSASHLYKENKIPMKY